MIFMTFARKNWSTFKSHHQVCLSRSNMSSRWPISLFPPFNKLSFFSMHNLLLVCGTDGHSYVSFEALLCARYRMNKSKFSSEWTQIFPNSILINNSDVGWDAVLIYVLIRRRFPFFYISNVWDEQRKFQKHTKFSFVFLNRFELSSFRCVHLIFYGASFYWVVTKVISCIFSWIPWRFHHKYEWGRHR